MPFATEGFPNIAIPALAIYGMFRNRIETIVSDAVVEAENIMPQIRLSLRKQNQTEQPKRKPSVRELPAKPTGAIGESVPLR